ANLFLINPNGIFFGPNSRLDVGGSFFGSTADSVLFDNSFKFSATNPDAPPLLTIKGPLGLQYGSNPGTITNQLSFLRVPDGQTLGLIGGDVNIPGGFNIALDGRIELGSVGANGVVKLTPTDTSFVLDYSGVQAYKDISLSDGARVVTTGESGGSIQVQGGNVSLRDRSDVFANTIGSQNGGGIVVRASQLSLKDGSRIIANVFGLGQGGDLSITTGELIVSDGAFVSASTVAEGDGGDLTVNASSTVELSSDLFAVTFGTGNAGNLSITTGQLIVKDGAIVSASTFGEGDSGNLTVDADSIQLIGTSADDRVRSGLLAQTNEIATGNAGDVKITTGELIVSDGARVSASAFGEGDGGNLTVDADSTVQLIGTSADGRSSSLVAQTEGKGNAGDVKITTEELIVSDGAEVSASTFGEGDGGNLTVNASSTVKVIGTSADGPFGSGLFAQANPNSKGNAGNLSITTGQLIVKDGAQVSASTRGEGNGGTLSIDASSTVQLIGTTADGRISSGLFAQTEGKGKAGDVNIATGELIVSDGAQVLAITVDEGDGGNLIVDADSTVQLIGTSADGRIVSGLFAQVNPGSKGNAGNLSITTGQLSVEDGARVSAATFGEGNGGNLTVNASESVQLIGTGTSADGEFPSGLFIQANREATGNAGDLLNITTDKLIISDGAEVSARSINKDSSAGTVDINANSIFLDNNGRITAETAGGDDSNIKLFSRDIRLLNESKIITEAQNTTTGGKIEIKTDTLVGLGDSDIIADADQGSGGRVEINAKGIFGLEFRDRLTPDNDITSTSERGSSFNGEVILNISQVDPTSGLNELPGILVDAEAILANDLCGFENDRIAGGSSFTIIGKGGLPPTPEDPVINAHRTVRWRTRPRLASNRQPLQAQASVRPRQDKKVIIEAQGWVIAKDGTIILTAQPFNGTPVEQILPNLDCHSGRGNREQGTGNRE
ncbi:beta strand repeat-containing protein, partial [Moorena producens]